MGRASSGDGGSADCVCGLQRSSLRELYSTAAFGIEEVVGDIEDEYDTTDHLMKKLNENTFILSGMVEIEDLLEKFPELGIEESDDYETIAGYIIHHIGRIPKVNEELIIERNKCIISKASPARIETVRIVMLPSDT